MRALLRRDKEEKRLRNDTKGGEEEESGLLLAMRPLLLSVLQLLRSAGRSAGLGGGGSGELSQVHPTGILTRPPHLVFTPSVFTSCPPPGTVVSQVHPTGILTGPSTGIVPRRCTSPVFTYGLYTKGDTSTHAEGSDSYSQTVYNTEGTRAHTHRELIRKWLWEPKGSSLEYIEVLGGGSIHKLPSTHKPWLPALPRVNPRLTRGI